MNVAKLAGQRLESIDDLFVNGNDNQTLAVALMHLGAQEKRRVSFMSNLGLRRRQQNDKEHETHVQSARERIAKFKKEAAALRLKNQPKLLPTTYMTKPPASIATHNKDQPFKTQPQQIRTKNKNKWLPNNSRVPQRLLLAVVLVLRRVVRA